MNYWTCIIYTYSKQLRYSPDHREIYGVSDNKFSEIGQHMFEITNAAKELRDDLNVVFMFHEDLQLVDGFMPVRKIKTVGKMLDDKFTPEFRDVA